MKQQTTNRLSSLKEKLSLITVVIGLVGILIGVGSSYIASQIKKSLIEKELQSNSEAISIILKSVDQLNISQAINETRLASIEKSQDEILKILLRSKG